MIHPVVGRCPVCGEALEVTRLHCRQCDTSVEGRFSLGRFLQLTPEQIAFAETFIRCEGKINRVEEELGISYPTVRNRLSDLIRALGYEVPDESAPTGPRRQDILAQLASGALTSEEALRLLKGR